MDKIAKRTIGPRVAKNALNSAPPADCLPFLGRHGHTWAVSIMNAEGEEVVFAQMHDGPSAARVFQEWPELACSIYRQTPKGWQRSSVEEAVA